MSGVTTAGRARPPADLGDWPRAEPARLRAADGRGAGHPLRPAVVHRRPRDPQGLQHHPGRAGERPRRGHDLRRLGHRRVQPGPGEPTSWPGPTRRPSSCCPGTARTTTGRPGLLRHLQPRRHPLRGLPPPRAAAHPRAGPRGRATPSSPRPRSSTSTSPTPTRRTPPAPLDSGSYFDLTVADLAERPAPAHGAHARGDGHPGRARPARGRPEPARDRPALHRRPHHGRHGHDRPAGGQGDGPPAGHPRQLHAQAAGRGPGLGHAHPPLAVARASTTPSPTPDDPYGLSDGGLPLHRRPARTTPARSPP